MKKYLLIFVISFLFPYGAIYGFGEYVNTSSFITDYSSNYFNFKLQDVSYRETESVFNISYNVKYCYNEVDKNNNSYLSSFSFLFPVLERNFLRFGVKPYTYSNINFSSNQYSYISADSDLQALAYNSDYESIGGISKAYLDYSFELSSDFLLGVQYSYSFGNLEQNKKIKLYDIEYSNSDTEDLYSVSYTLNDSMIVKKIHNFTGHSFKLESKFRIDRDELVLSALYDFPMTVKTRLFYNPFVSVSNQSLGVYDNLEQLESALDANQIIDNKYDGGIKKVLLQYKKHYQNSDYFTLRLWSQNKFNYSSDLMYLPDLKINSIYFGYEFYNPNYRLSTFDYVNYKIGFFYSSLDDHNHDYGLEFNYGINYSENNNMFISFRYGNRSHSLLGFDNEEYYLIKFNLENIENWFLKGDY